MPAVFHRQDLAGRLLAAAVFILGIALLVVVFLSAWHLLEAPVERLGLPIPAHGAPPAAATIGAALSAFGMRIVLLVLMTVAGSIITSKGVHLYCAASHPHPVTEADHGPATTGRPDLTLAAEQDKSLQKPLR